MAQDPRLDVKCPKCRKPWHLAPEEIVPERKSYLCPRCGEGVHLTPDQEKIATDVLRRNLAEKTKS